MFPADDPRNNVSPTTEQRFEDALERQRSRESSFQGALPSSPMQHIEPVASQERVSESQAWVHWEYNPEDWALFEKIDWKPARRTFWLVVGLCFLFPADIIVIIWGSMSMSFVSSPLFPLLPVFLLPSIVPLIALIMYSDTYNQAKKRHKVRQQDQPHRVTIAEQGVWEAGTYFPFDGLKEVKMTLEPLTVQFCREKRFRRREDTLRGDTLHILIPRGHEEEAAHLVQRFHTEVIEERKQARRRSMNPPEPV
jgi:hypothetical protein